MQIDAELLAEAITIIEQEKRVPENLRPFIRAYRLVYENQHLMPEKSEAFVNVALAAILSLIEVRHGANIGKKIYGEYWSSEPSSCNRA